MRVRIEYIATGVIKITTPYRQCTFNLTKNFDAFSIDFKSLKKVDSVGSLSPSAKFTWDARGHELYVRVGDDLVTMPTDTTNLIISVAE